MFNSNETAPIEPLGLIMSNNLFCLSSPLGYLRRERERLGLDTLVDVLDRNIAHDAMK